MGQLWQMRDHGEKVYTDIMGGKATVEKETKEVGMDIYKKS